MKTLEEKRASQRQATRRYRERNRERIRQLERANYEKNKDKLRLKSRLHNVARWKQRQYGITDEQFEELLTLHKGRCAVCKSEFGENNVPQIDHCHKTKVFRGLLCGRCNRAEGLLKTPENILALYHYVMKNELFYQGGN